MFPTIPIFAIIKSVIGESQTWLREKVKLSRIKKRTDPCHMGHVKENQKLGLHTNFEYDS